MDADTLDYGPYDAYLRQFGPPEVVALPSFAGNGSATEKVDDWWELVESLSLHLVASATVATRFPRVRLFAGSAIPFAQFQAAVGTAASQSSTYTFTRDVTESGVTSGATIVTQLAPLMMLPAWTAVVDVIGGVAGDAVSGVQVYRRRFQAVKIER